MLHLPVYPQTAWSARGGGWILPLYGWTGQGDAPVKRSACGALGSTWFCCNNFGRHHIKYMTAGQKP
jgi:hypothetical protein